MKATVRALGGLLTRLIHLLGIATLSLATAHAAVTVSIIAPANGAAVTAGSNITLSATAGATGGYTISKVEFFHGGTNLIGTDTSSPHSVTWSNVPAGSYTLTARATAIRKNKPDQTQTSSPVAITVNVSAPPSVAITSPTNGASYTAPASITLTATASDTDGVQKVEFFHSGSNLIATVTSSPYTYNWTNVGAGSYSVTAKATDNLGISTASAPVGVTVGSFAPAGLYFIQPDHLNTPRAIYNEQQQLVWRWDQQEPFGNSPPNENPSGLGTFECNIRFAGQYFDKETNLAYNYFRDFDPGIGRYVQSDPIGLKGGINTYLYAINPLTTVDPSGLMGRGSMGMSKLAPKGSREPRFSGACGPEYDPNNNYPSNFFGIWSFAKACEKHDACYSICRKPKELCDDEFRDNMDNECGTVPPAIGFGFARILCNRVARDYYWATAIGGTASYIKGQAQCKSCAH